MQSCSGLRESVTLNMAKMIKESWCHSIDLRLPPIHRNTGMRSCKLLRTSNHTGKQKSKWKLETQTCKQQSPKQFQIPVPGAKWPVHFLLPLMCSQAWSTTENLDYFNFFIYFLYRRLWLCLSYIWPESYSSELCGSLLSTNLLLT